MIATQTNELKEILEARAYALNILRHVFIEEPKRDFLKVLQTPEYLTIFPFKNDHPLINEGIDKVITYLDQSEVVYSSKEFDKLHWDFTKLVVGPFDLPAPPWESSYVRKDKLLFQQTTKEVERFYKKFGVGIADNQMEASDHIGLELDFMYHLTLLTYNDLNKTGELNLELLQEQQRFFKLHLGRFYQLFATNVLKHSNTLYYQGFAMILKGYLAFDYKLIEELITFNDSQKGGNSK